MPKPLQKLSQQHYAFIEYLIQTQGHKTEAALRAGFAEASAAFKGSQLANDPLIKAEYERRLAEIKQAASITTEALVNELAAIAFGNIDDLAEWTGKRKVPNPDYIPEDARKERDIRRQTNEALGIPNEELDPTKNEVHQWLYQFDSVVFKDSKNLTRRVKGTIAEISLTPTKFGEKLSIKTHSKLDAIGKLANMLGINQPKRIEVNTKIENTNFGIKRRAPLEPEATPDTARDE